MEAVLTPIRMSSRPVRGFVALMVTLMLGLGLSTIARAQATSGDITGTVKDPAGALVSKATVVVTNEDTGVAATTQTGTAGDYRVSNLLPGKYDIVVTDSAAGFQAFTLKGVLVELNKTSTADVSLKVGTSASVEVSADAGAVLDTTSTNLTTTFSNVELSDLPVSANGGSGQSGVLNVSLLSPGVASSGGLGIGNGPSIGGQRPRNNNFEIEGVDNNNKAVTGFLVYIPNDAVGNFTLITNQFSPDFGHSSGGQFNTTIVSGTNTIHGKVYEYFQNRNLNAASGVAGGKVPNPDYDNNRYGGQVGGPVLKNKLFYFGNFERNKIGQVLSGYVCTPTSAGFTQLNSLATSYGFSATNLGQFAQYTPAANFAGGAQVNASNDNACGTQAVSTTNPNGLQYITVTNNVSGTGALSANIPLGNYLYSGPDPTLFYALVTGADYTISSKDNLRARYIHDWQASTDNGASSGETILPEFYTTQPYKWHLFALSEYHTFTPNLTNEFRLGFNRYSNTETAGSTTYPGLGVFPELNFYDLGNLQLGADGNAPQFTIQNLYQATDNISYVRGKHTFKVGFDGRKYISPQGFTQRARGDYEWNVTDQFLHDLAPDSNGFAERSAGNHTYYGDQTALYAYANDTWRVTPTVTLNMGLRYEFTSVPVGERAQQLNSAASVPGLVTFNAPQPTYTSFVPRLGISWAPDEKTSVRVGVGLADDVLFDNLGTLSFPPQYSVTEDVGAPCTTSTPPTPTLTCPPAYAAYLAPNFLKNGGLPTSTGTALATYPSIAAQQAATSAYLPNQVVPYAETWTLTVQRTFLTDYTAEIGYVGTKGIHLPTQDQINVQPRVNSTNVLPTQAGPTLIEQAGSGATTLAAIQALSNIVPIWKANNFTSKITSYQPYSYSNYNALVANVTRRFQKGLQLNLSYTWSKTMDDATDEVFATVLTPRREQNSQCIKCDYSRSALDRTNRLSLEAHYEVQAYKHSDNMLLRNGIGNWIIDPIYTYESPEYATVLSGDNANLNGDSGSAIDRAIINPLGKKGTGSGVTAITNSSGATIGYTANNPLAYYIQAGPGTLPNAHRNTLPLRPINNWDLSLYKRFTLRERYGLEIGIQAWNVMNHPQYIPGSVDTVNGPSFTSSYNVQTVSNAFFNHPEKEFLNNSRNMQLSGKINF
jgi:hypothetical protein